MEAKFLGLVFECPECGRIEATAVDFGAQVDECDTCGYHIEITADVRCPSCQKTFDVVLRDDDAQFFG